MEVVADEMLVKPAAEMRVRSAGPMSMGLPEMEDAAVKVGSREASVGEMEGCARAREYEGSACSIQPPGSRLLLCVSALKRGEEGRR